MLPLAHAPEDLKTLDTGQVPGERRQAITSSGWLVGLLVVSLFSSAVKSFVVRAIPSVKYYIRTPEYVHFFLVAVCCWKAGNLVILLGHIDHSRHHLNYCIIAKTGPCVLL